MQTCHDCGNEYTRPSMHWAQSSCSYPKIDERHHEILTGMMMGDAWAEGSDQKARVRIESVTKEYLEHLSKELPISRGVSLRRTAEEMAELTGSNVDNTRDVYKLDTISHPELGRYRSWYQSGEKVWPDDIQLTPITLKHWYCGDGHYNNAGSNRHIQLAMSNEMENTDKVSRIFDRADFTTSNYNVQDTVCDLTFTVDETERLFEYMGEPLPGFEYKWP